MHFHTRNINTAFAELCNHFDGHRYISDDGMRDFRKVSRVPYSNPNGSGFTLRIDEPVTITYEKPTECVLFNAARDCNPFALLYEALWMLAGRNDVESLTYYSSNFRTFSDDGKTLNGAYGYRWRKAWGWEDGIWQHTTDQLDLLVAHLKANPASRRAVLTMWNVEDDLLKIGGTGNRMRCTTCDGTGFRTLATSEMSAAALDSGADYETEDCPTCNRTTWTDEPGSRDVCCNLSVKFSLRTVEGDAVGNQADFRVLDMTVFNRSNDMVWGALGANYVTFSVLLQYMAARLGVGVGRYNQISDDLHVYDRHVAEMPKWLAEYGKGDVTDFYQDANASLMPSGMRADVWGREFRTVSLVRDPARFDEEVKQLVETFSGDNPNRTTFLDYSEPFFTGVAVPMLTAFAIHKHHKDTPRAIDECSAILADDWRIAAVNWLERRRKK